MSMSSPRPAFPCHFWIIIQVLGAHPVEAELTRELRGSDPGPFNRIQRAFSVKGAFLETSQDTYRLQSLFPRLGRSLKRRI